MPNPLVSRGEVPNIVTILRFTVTADFPGAIRLNEWMKPDRRMNDVTI